VTRFAFLLAAFLVCAGMQMDVRQQSVETSPQREQADQTDPHNTMEILPVSYIGCWRGVVTAPDTLQNLNGCLNGPSVPELYTLCYRKTLTGNFEVTFGEVQMDSEMPAEYQVSGTAGKIEVLSSDGVARVRLRGFIHFDQKQTSSSASTDSKWSMDERTEMNCEIKDGKMWVAGAFTQTSDGADCFRGTWHAGFERFDN
jgi:hypothetical protein